MQATAAAMLMATLAVAPAPVFAGSAGDSATEALSHRVFPLFEAIGHDARAMAALKARAGIAAVLEARQTRREACEQDLPCRARAMLWSDTETAAVSAAIPADASAADDGAAAQSRRELVGINTIIRTYALGEVPRYPDIDGPGTVDPREAKARLQAAVWLAATPRAGSVQTVDPSVDFALALLDVNDRADAAGFEPLTGGYNAAAVKRSRGLAWNRYRYSALIVTGVGPETPDTPLSAFGKYHLRLAANRFAQGDAAFVIVTGGRAHPRATRFTEAVEMRRALIERYAIPADAILIEPYARHTTTNLRNATRLLAAIGAPPAMETVIVSNPGQSATIESPAFVERNRSELGYQPGTVGPRLSPTALVFRPATQSARIDPRDPLDP